MFLIKTVYSLNIYFSQNWKTIDKKMNAKLKGNQVKLTPISHYASAATFPHLVARKPVDTIFGPVNLSL